MSDIFREVDEEVRKDRLSEIWKTYGKYVIAGCVVLVLATAATVGWREYRISVRETDSERYRLAERLLAENKPIEAMASFAALAEEAGTGYRYLARLQQAAIQARQGDLDGAVASYDALAADSGASAAMRDLAAFQAASLLLDSAGADEVARRLEPLAADDSPWRYSARELQGLLAYREGDHDKARTIFQGILTKLDPDLPSGVRLRVSQMLAVLGDRG